MLACEGDAELGSSIGRFGEFLEAQGAWFDCSGHKFDPPAKQA